MMVINARGREQFEDVFGPEAVKSGRFSLGILQQWALAREEGNLVPYWTDFAKAGLIGEPGHEVQPAAASPVLVFRKQPLCGLCSGYDPAVARQAGHPSDTVIGIRWAGPIIHAVCGPCVQRATPIYINWPLSPRPSNSNLLQELTW